MGDHASEKITEYTFAFKAPPTPNQEPLAVVTTHHSHGSGTRMPCRASFCLRCPRRDTVVYHVDCYNIVKSVGMRLALSDIWIIGLWTIPAMRYPAYPEISTALVERTCVYSHDPWFLDSLPTEIKVLILQDCQESAFWRLLSAIHRVMRFQPLLAADAVTEVMPTCMMNSWNRGESLSKSRFGSYVSTTWFFDDLGIRRVDQQSDISPTLPIDMPGDVWFFRQEHSNIAGTRMAQRVSKSR